MEVGRTTGRLLAAAAVVIVCGLVAGYGVAKRGRPEPVRVGLAATPAAGEVAPKRMVYVHVAGAVAAPGLYDLPEGARVADAIKAAGGATAAGDLDAVNLAAKVRDGDKILIAPKGHVPGSPAGAGGASGARLNLNTASQSDLEQLPGIGPALAARIIDFRERNGGFRSVNDLQKVSGIGPKKFEQLKDHVTV